MYNLTLVYDIFVVHHFVVHLGVRYLCTPLSYTFIVHLCRTPTSSYTCRTPLSYTFVVHQLCRTYLSYFCPLVYTYVYDIGVQQNVYNKRVRQRCKTNVYDKHVRQCTTKILYTIGNVQEMCTTNVYDKGVQQRYIVHLGVPQRGYDKDVVHQCTIIH